ncbi:hypothetical protein L3Y34_006302 [Caenorhabditis briggsae]|uniref:Uncharacterized protein n=1 Tax=Caenorhabditis briggsae TaxID=6238 RepID=A0AAE8ZX79_CAEBR|nr:hypothetical protein L3Y34_006302 [Caenorhabditis briggsae]
MSFLLSTLYNVDLLAYGGLVKTADEMFIWALALTFIPFAINGVTFMKFWQIHYRSPSLMVLSMSNICMANFTYS